MSSIDAPVSQENTSFWPLALRYGLIAGLVLIAVGLVMQMTGLVDPAAGQQGMTTGNMISTVINILVMAGAAVMAVGAHRDTNLGGWISFGKSFKLSMAVFLIVSVLTAVWTFIYIGMVNPELMEMAREQALERAGGEIPEEAAKMMELFISPLFFAATSLFATLLLGLIIALVVSLVMKKEPQTDVM